MRARACGVRRVLVLRGGAVGDFVLTLPALAAMRAAWPDARITLGCYPRVAELAVRAGLADETFSLDAAAGARLFTARTALPWSGFDVAVSYLNDPDETVLANLRAACIPRVAAIPPLPARGHAADHLRGGLRQVGIEAPLPAIPRLEMDAAWREEGRGRLSGRGTRCVLLHPGSGARRKNWPAERFAELAGLIESRLAATPALLFGEADEHVRGVLRRIAPAVQELPPLGLADLASCLAAAEGYVGNDSGITHLAAAAGVRGVALFGPTDPAVWGPREGHAVRVLRANPPTAEGLAELPVRAVFEALAQRIGVQDP